MEVEDAVGEITKSPAAPAGSWSRRGKSSKHITNGPAIAIPFSTANGHFIMEVCFNA
ncbi:hypothetical protein DFAR_3290008 [Desulfarculales bacterium]